MHVPPLSSGVERHLSMSGEKNRDEGVFVLQPQVTKMIIVPNLAEISQVSCPLANHPKKLPADFVQTALL